MRKQILSTLCLLLASTAFAQIPSDYYSTADGKSKSELKTALHKKIKSHTILSYNDLWEAYETTDVVPGTSDQIFDMFSTETYYYSTRGSEVNREHVVPQSWWGGGGTANAYSDLFNVLPSDATANSNKSNYPLGKITGSVKYDNGRIRIGKGTEMGGAPYVFEPYDEFKGDFARIYLYVATCYENISWVEKYYAFDGGVNAYPTLKQWIIPTLLEWNRQDPVSEWEIERQENVYGIQKNRNPFIDYPVLAEFIWGDSTAINFNLATAIPNVLNGYDNAGGDEGGEENPDTPDNPDDTPDVNPDDIPKGDELFIETFDSVMVGNDNATSGSSTAWSGNEQFTSVSTVYQAGGVIRMGSSKKTGSITTVPLNFNGGNLIIEIDVKGWTSVEGKLLVSATGSETQSLSYSATMSDAYETVKVVLKNVSAYPTVTIETSTKRCFITAIRVYKEGTADAIESVIPDSCTDNAYYTLSGQRLIQKPERRGIYIHKNRKVLIP